MIKVLVVEDSVVARELLVHILNSDAAIEVIGTAADGAAALKFLTRHQPDVITMDIHLPGMDGFETTRRIMETSPVPIIMVSASWNPEEVALTFKALEAGALAAVEKPRGVGHAAYDAMAGQLIQTVKTMSEVKVIKRWARSRRSTPPEAAATEPAAPAAVLPRAATPHKVVAIGASTGGPPVLQTILAGLTADFPAPLLIVQHIAAGFTQGLADWLGQSTAFPIRIAVRGEILLPGHAYLAPDDHHLGLEPDNRIALSGAAPENGLRPAVSYLFRSVTTVCGAAAVGVLLTGMGRDGADELKRMKAAGAITIAQDKESSVVHGMPGEAIKIEAATYVLPPERIAAMLQSLVAQRS